eukprot:10154804-Heterocapsa_arctica.AAC.1
MTPARGWHLEDGGQTVRYIRGRQTDERETVARKLARDLRGDVVHGSKHDDAAVLDLGLQVTARQVPEAAIRDEAGGVPEAHERLHAEFVLERAQREGDVEDP